MDGRGIVFMVFMVFRENCESVHEAVWVRDRHTDRRSFVLKVRREVRDTGPRGETVQMCSEVDGTRQGAGLLLCELGDADAPERGEGVVTVPTSPWMRVGWRDSEQGVT
jgi:hypothetical protein